MPIHLIRSKATAEQVAEMLDMLGEYIKLAIDIEQHILAGGGALHADCEAVLLESGSHQESVWGADWVPSTRRVHFEALINLRPRQHTLSMTIQDPSIRDHVERIVRDLLEDE
jgi:hypothetical protein